LAVDVLGEQRRVRIAAVRPLLPRRRSFSRGCRRELDGGDRCLAALKADIRRLAPAAA
jgi:hypothetical protein